MARSRSKPGQQEPVTFTRAAAGHIAKVTKQSEGEARRGEPLRFGPRQRPNNCCNVFRVASHGTSAWDKGATATVTFLTMTSTPNTATAVNLFADLASGATSKSCAVARDGTAWYLIAAECD